jgi:hypothetical protein
MKLPASRAARLVVAACVVVSFGVLAAVVQASIPDSSGVIHGCYQTNDSTHNGGAALQIIDSNSTATCKENQTAIQWNQQGPPGTSVTNTTVTVGDGTACNSLGGAKFQVGTGTPTYACNGQQGNIGPRGPQGPAGTGPVSQSCESGSFVTGFDGSGNIICSCPHTGYSFTMTAFVTGTLQAWPAEVHMTDTDPNNSGCSVTVATPFSTDTGCNPICAQYISGGFADTGWTFVSSTGYPSGTTFSIHVDNPDCKTVGASASVSNDFPLCSNSSDVFSSGDSTDTAIFTPN